MSLGRGKVSPTKIELIRLRRSLRVSKTVHKILEDKREVLLRRLDEVIDSATQAREEAWAPLSDAYRALYDAYLKMGPARLEGTAAATPVTTGVDVNVRRVVGVEIPSIQVTGQNVGLTYGFAETTSTLDQATRLMRAALPSLAKAAEHENAIFRLASELEKTQRLLNALEYIIIPGYENAIRYISSTLEERAREDFVKLKHIKRVLERRQVTA